MLEASQSTYPEAELDRLQRLRASVMAFQKSISSLPADEASNIYNEQFNQLRSEAKSLLRRRGFEKKVAPALTEELVAERTQTAIIPRLSAIVIFGVILALLGLGINSIILEDVLINSLGCLISSSGMLLIIGAFTVLTMANVRQKQKLTNFGELYQRCTTLIYEISHELNLALPGFEDRPVVDVPEIPSVIEMVLDSLEKQAADWQEKLRELEEERLTLGTDTPMELTINIDFVQRELNRVTEEIDRINGRVLMIPEIGVKTDSKPNEIIRPTASELARSNTADMPVVQREEETAAPAEPHESL